MADSGGLWNPHDSEILSFAPVQLQGAMPSNLEFLSHPVLVSFSFFLSLAVLFALSERLI